MRSWIEGSPVSRLVGPVFKNDNNGLVFFIVVSLIGGGVKDGPTGPRSHISGTGFFLTRRSE